MGSDRDWDGHFQERYTSSSKHDWETPQWLFDALNAEFDFALDAAASKVNAKCHRWLGPGGVREDALACNWYRAANPILDNLTTSVFCNPPYGRDIERWYKKAYEESRQKGTIVVLLVNANTETTYWRDYVWPHAAEVRFISGRVGFCHPKEPDLATKQTKGSALIVWAWYHDGRPKVRNVDRDLMKAHHPMPPLKQTDKQFTKRRKAPPPPVKRKKPPPPPPRRK